MANLASFVVKRLIAMVILAWAIVTVVFFLAHATPYDPITIYLGQHATVANVHQLRHLFGLTGTVWQQYVNYLGGLLHGNLGYSEESDYFGQPVWGILQTGAPTTLKLGFYGILVAVVVGLPIGLVSALKQNSAVDYAGQSFMILLYVIPAFILVPVAQLVFGDLLRWFPVTGWGDSGWFGPWQIFPNPGATFHEMVLPVLIYGGGLAGFFAKSFRSFMLEVLRQDYIRTARAKGLKNRVVIYTHACKNTLLPLASIVGPTVAYLIVGAFVIERFFGIPGIGYLTAQSVIDNDFPVIEATTLLLAIFVVLANLLTDISYAVIDPRVRL